MKMRSQARGFTLIELMIVVVLTGIMASMALPSFRSFVASQRVKTAASDFAMAAVFARSEAIKRNANVTLKPASTGATGWKDGWTVAVDTTELSKQSAYTNVTFDGPSELTYNRSGRLGAAVNPMKISLDNSVRCVALDLSGMPNTTVSTSGNCP